MPITAHPPEADVGATTAHAVVESRFGGELIGTPAPPSGALLPSGGTVRRDPAPAPARALALDAVRLLRRWHQPERWPGGWSDAAFRREVALIRSHLAPMRTRRSLASSFGREAGVVLGTGSGGGSWIADDPGPLRMAYALRWIELGSSEVAGGRGGIAPR